MINEVTHDTLDFAWGEVLPQIRKGIRHSSGGDEQALYDAVRDGRMRMWVIHDERGVQGCLILSIHQSSSHKTLFIEMAAGRDMGAVVPEVELLLRAYKEHVGADSIEASCRPGLAKLLPNWKTKAITLELA